MTIRQVNIDDHLMAPRKPDLYPEEFKLLLASLDPDETEAAKKYHGLRDKLVRHCFKCHEFLRADELADQALDVLAKKLSSEEIRNIESYTFKVLDNLLANHRRTPRMTLLSENLPARDNPERAAIDKADGERKVECFRQCASHLKPIERWLIYEYYPNEECNLEERRRQIASKLGIGAGALTTRMNRLRTKLEKCWKDCYGRSSRRK
jgi:DNA-directed RNA polymerase specialized sigma24 family protein